MTERRDGCRGEAGWVEELSRNAVAVEKPLEARLGEGMVRWMGEGEIKAGGGKSIRPV